MSKIKIIKDQNTFFFCDTCDAELEIDDQICPKCGSSVKEISNSKRAKVQSNSLAGKEVNDEISIEDFDNKRKNRYKILTFFSALSKFVAILLGIIGVIFLFNTDLELTFYQYFLISIGLGFVVFNLLFYAQLVDIVMDIKSETHTIISQLVDSDKLE